MRTVCRIWKRIARDHFSQTISIVQSQTHLYQKPSHISSEWYIRSIERSKRYYGISNSLFLPVVGGEWRLGSWASLPHNQGHLRAWSTPSVEGLSWDKKRVSGLSREMSRSLSVVVIAGWCSPSVVVLWWSVTEVAPILTQSALHHVMRCNRTWASEDSLSKPFRWGVLYVHVMVGTNECNFPLDTFRYIHTFFLAFTASSITLRLWPYLSKYYKMS